MVWRLHVLGENALVLTPSIPHTFPGVYNADFLLCNIHIYLQARCRVYNKYPVSCWRHVTLNESNTALIFLYSL